MVLMLPQWLPLQIAPCKTEKKNCCNCVAFLVTHPWFQDQFCNLPLYIYVTITHGNQNKGFFYSGGKTKGGANAEMALGGEFAWHAVEVEEYSHRHPIWVSRKSRTFGSAQCQRPRQEPNSIHSQEICLKQAHWTKRAVLSWLLLHHAQESCLELLGHQAQASWDSSEGVCTGTEALSLLLGQTYTLTNALLMNTHMERRQLSPVWTLRSREWTFTSQLCLTTTPFEHCLIKETGLETSGAQLFSVCDP